MKKMVTVIGSTSISNQLSKVLRDKNIFNIDYLDIKSIVKNEELAIENIKSKSDLVMISNINMDERLYRFYEKLKLSVLLPIVPLDLDVFDKKYININENIALEIIQYITFGGEDNINNLANFLVNNILGINVKEEIIKPKEVDFNGIFHPDSKSVYQSFNEYKNWYKSNKKFKVYKWVGILTHKNNWANNNINIETAIIKSLEEKNIGVIPVFSYLSNDNKNVKSINKIIKSYFSENESIVLEVLINFQQVMPIKTNSSKDIFEETVSLYKNMNIPIFRPIICHMQDEKAWIENNSGVGSEIAWAYTTPEMVGSIEQIIVGCKDKDNIGRPINDRVEKLTSRISKYINLKSKDNKDKVISMILHSAPCSSVEATIGLGAGLDVFESCVRLLTKLKENGYSVENMPKNGEELHNLIMTKKAYQDFRWTSVEDIVKSDGVVFEMELDGENGYLNYFNKLPQEIKNEMIETWGEPPGEGMVFNNKIIITGLKFGQVYIMVQPKRGCYGAKCTGEVCKILHNPSCPMPHQYLATYRYIENIINADCVIHVGTDGSLEYLPGKSNALSNKCYPDIVLSSLPNLYIYNAGACNEGVLSKRRSSAVIIDYLPSVNAFGTDNYELLNLINKYIEYVVINKMQAEEIKKEIDSILSENSILKEVIDKEISFLDGVKNIKNYLLQSMNNYSLEKLHILGDISEKEDVVSLIKEYLEYNEKIEQIANEYDNMAKFELDLVNVINDIVNNNEKSNYDELKYKVYQLIENDCKDIYIKLQSTDLEIKNVLRGLNGEYIEPGLGGLPSQNLKGILPTGRNLFLMDVEKIPSKEAYSVGEKLSQMLIDKYVDEEGKIPEKIAMNMISTDISLAKGQQLSQILYLIGVRPIWDSSGKVIEFEVIPLEELKRPRIDVTVRISGVLRDSYPKIIENLDEVISRVSYLDESIEENYIKKHTIYLSEKLKSLGNEDIYRKATIRIFGDKPGTYGAGVDLILKASAWNDEKDIAKTFAQFSSYAYGENLNGNFAKDEFIENIKKVDLSYEIGNSKRNNILSCGFAAGVHGGFNLLSKIHKGKDLIQYYGSTKDKKNIKISTMSDEISKTIDETLLNPIWKQNIKKQKYIGASEIMKKIQTVYEWQCTCNNINDKYIDSIVENYINDKEMREWLVENNIHAAEEIGRRFLELHKREKWQSDKDVLKNLKRNYISLEGEMEGKIDTNNVEIQGGNIDIITSKDIEPWKVELKVFDDIF